jgi:predicted DNA-binding transcriptional regulator AlpA
VSITSTKHIDSLELIADPKLAKLLGFSLRSFCRWDADENLGFPPPISINGRNHRRRADIEAWLRERALASFKSGAGGQPKVQKP